MPYGGTYIGERSSAAPLNQDSPQVPEGFYRAAALLPQRFQASAEALPDSMRAQAEEIRLRRGCLPALLLPDGEKPFGAGKTGGEDLTDVLE